MVIADVIDFTGGYPDRQASRPIRIINHRKFRSAQRTCLSGYQPVNETVRSKNVATTVSNNSNGRNLPGLN
jgi:hypothetical protein